MGFLRDPIWQFTINIVVGLIGIFITSIVSVAIFRRQQNRKGITYRIISDTPILSLKEEIKGTIQLLFRTKSVSNARLVILKIWNSENTPILPGDFIDPIRLSFGANSEILDAEMLESVPYHLKDKAKSSLKIETESIVLEPILLNSRNSITLKILIAQTPPLTREFNISAHIVGVDHIHNFHRFPPIIVSLARLFTYFSYILFLLLIIYIFLSKYESNGKLKLIYMLIFVLVAVSYVIAFIMLGSIFYSVVYKTSYIYAVKYLVNKFIQLLNNMIYEDITLDRRK